MHLTHYIYVPTVFNSILVSETHPAFKFIECLRDNFLFQHVHSNTRHIFGQEPSCLDLVLSDKEELIENLKIGDKLVTITVFLFNITCQFEKRRGKSTET